MKKLLIVAVVALLALALVACGGDDTATTTAAATTAGDAVVTTPAATTAGTVITTVPATDDATVITTTAPITGDDPVVTTVTLNTTAAPSTGDDTTPTAGVDIMNGDYADMAINPTWQGIDAIAFEDHHAALDFNVALVTLWQESENGIYETLFLTVEDDEGNQSFMVNEDYKFVVIINNERIEIERISLYHQVTYGYVRLDLGDWTWKNYTVNEDGTYDFDVRLEILDAFTDEVAYFAWFTDPEWNGIFTFTPPQPIEMVVDPSRDPAHVAIPGTDAIPTEGPVGFSNELYGNLFDDSVRTKLCTDDVTTPIVWKYNEAVRVVSYSLVGANDDATYSDRIILSFKLYGSTNGTSWELIDEQNVDAPESPLNYQERNFKLTTAVEDYTYFKLEPIGASKYQMSGIILYTDAK